jgi:formamidopyrimidine-DNA glycosylase
LPELPEVETVVRTLAPWLVGQRIERAEFLAPLVLRGAPPPPLAARTVESVTRKGKHIVIEMDRGCLVIHLGMTGKLLRGSVPNPYTRARLWLSDGELLYDDVRQFGRILWSEGAPERLAELGPDPLLLASDHFARMVRARRGRIKPLLLDQRFLSGLGNIYTDEALFLARIHPLTPASRLSRARAVALHLAVVDVLAAAIESGGSSISDYVDAEGRRGSYQQFHKVYGREGEPCPQCGRAIRRIVVAQRGTHFCPRCQRP